MKEKNEITAIMRDKELNFIPEYEIVKVIYGDDDAHRCVVLKTDKGYYTYQFETLITFDEDERRYLPKDSLPAYWQPARALHKPVYENLTDLERELSAEPEYKTYFNN